MFYHTNWVGVLGYLFFSPSSFSVIFSVGVRVIVPLDTMLESV